MRFGLVGALTWLLGVAGSTSCSNAGECGAIASVPPAVTVMDAVTQAPICDALVVAQCTNTDAGATLVAFGPLGYEVDAAVAGCQYGPGLPSVCDAASLTITKSGYEQFTVPRVEIRYSKHCPGPIPDAQKVSVALVPD